MSDFYNYHEDDQKRPEQSANDYNYYQQTSDGARRTYSPYDTPEPNKSEKKKGNFGVKLVKAVCLGLAFGLVAGGVFWGIGGLMGVTNGKGSSEQRHECEYCKDIFDGCKNHQRNGCVRYR